MNKINKKIFLLLGLILGLSGFLYAQGFIERRIDNYIAKTYTSTFSINEQVMLFGWGLSSEIPYSSGINRTTFAEDGNYISDSLFQPNLTINYFPWLQGAAKRMDNFIYLNGSGGEGFLSVNNAAWLAKYSIAFDSLLWINEIPAVDSSDNSIAIESVILPSGNIMTIMTESIGTSPQKFFVRLLKFSPQGEIIFEKHIRNDDFWYMAYSLLLNEDDQLVAGIQYREIGIGSNIQLWKIDTLGNILDIYDSGTTNNEDKNPNKIVQRYDR